MSGNAGHHSVCPASWDEQSVIMLDEVKSRQIFAETRHLHARSFDPEQNNSFRETISA